MCVQCGVALALCGSRSFVCVCVRVGWCVCINNCLASCCAPIRDSIPPGLEGGEVFCYADTIDGNCRPVKNLKIWPPVCVRTPSLYAHTSSGRESRRVLLDRFVEIAPLETVVRVDSHLENDANQVSAVFMANTCLNFVRSPSDSSSMTVSLC